MVGGRYASCRILKASELKLVMHNHREFGNRDFVMAHALIEIGEKRGGFRRNYGGFPVGSGESIDGGERLPVGGD